LWIADCGLVLNRHFGLKTEKWRTGKWQTGKWQTGKWQTGKWQTENRKMAFLIFLSAIFLSAAIRNPQSAIRNPQSHSYPCIYAFSQLRFGRVGSSQPFVALSIQHISGR
jgi:hypothetical protein